MEIVGWACGAPVGLGRVIARRRSDCDRRVTDDEIAVHQAGELPWGDAVGGLVECEGEHAVKACRDGRTRQRPLAVAQAHAVKARAVQHRVAQRDGRRRERLARADRDGVRVGIGGEDVERRATADAEAATLTNGVVMGAAVAPERAAAGVEQRALALAEPTMAGEEGFAAAAGQEAEVLGVGLAGDRQAVAARELANLPFAQLAEREAQPGERLGGDRRERVALVLVGVGGDAQQAVGDARVVPGDERRGTEPPGQLEHRVESYLTVAAHAGVRRQAGGVLRQPRLDDVGAKLGTQVE